MKKYKVVLNSTLALILIFICASCSVTKDIYIGFEYPNFVKSEPIEIKVGEKIGFKVDDSYEYLVVIEKANEFLDTDSDEFAAKITSYTNNDYASNLTLVEKIGMGEYFFRVYCKEKNKWSEKPSRIIISE